jgi:hypothetical protein
MAAERPFLVPVVVDDIPLTDHRFKALIDRERKGKAL